MSVRLDEDTKDRRDLPAAATKRSESLLDAAAMRAFVDGNAE